MPVVNCPEIDCQFDTGDVNDAAGAVLLKYHLDRIHPAPAMSKPLVFPLPKLKGGVTEDEFKTFEQESSRSLLMCRRPRPPPIC